MIKNLKERIIGISGSVSGVTSILGSWQICHNLCLGIIAFLGFIGITTSWMPFLFLTKITSTLWTIGFLLLLITFVLYIKKKCISKNLIMFNSGLIIAGIPFEPLQKFSIIFWIVGGSLAVAAIIIFVKGKIQKGRLAK